MSRRNLLRKQLDLAWHETIVDYNLQRINSEGGLQSRFLRHLESRLDPKTRRTFVQPTIDVVDQGDVVRTRIPDIVVCNSRRVIAVIEVKYRPQVQPDWSKDVETFRLLRRTPEAFVRNDRYAGKLHDDEPYLLADDTLLVWAGIHPPCPHQVRDHAHSTVLGTLLCLHAETRHGDNAVVRVA